MSSLSRRVLTLLQFTRFALVFTAISNAQASLLLDASLSGPAGGWPVRFDPWLALWMGLTSVGLYTFGMSLNDIVDRRRDAHVAADRPLPSGRIGVGTAHAVAALLLLLALGAGSLLAVYADRTPLTLGLLAGVLTLICFYDLAGKYLVPLGLLSLGLIRFFHAALAAPTLPVVWHPLLLLNHVTILSALAYHWEQKRPALSRKHVLLIGAGLIGLNGAFVGAVVFRRGWPLRETWMEDIGITPALAWPALAVALFAWLGTVLYHRAADSRAAGKTVMLVGLLWLIVYDAAFVGGHVHWIPAVLLLLLVPVAWLGVRTMRAWTRLGELSERPGYFRAR